MILKVDSKYLLSWLDHVRSHENNGFGLYKICFESYDSASRLQLLCVQQAYPANVFDDS